MDMGFLILLMFKPSIIVKLLIIKLLWLIHI